MPYQLVITNRKAPIRPVELINEVTQSGFNQLLLGP